MLKVAFNGNHGPKGQLWTTESVIGKHLFGIVFALELAEPYRLTVDQTGWFPMVRANKFRTRIGKNAAFKYQFARCVRVYGFSVPLKLLYQ